MLKSITDLCHIISGGTPKTTVSSYWNGNIHWISIKDFISTNRYIYSTEKTITELGLKHSSTNLLMKDDIIISARGTVGEVAILSNPMTFNQSCYGIRSKDYNILDQYFLFYWLKSHKYDIQTGAHGAVFNTITRNDFDRLKINVPTIELQRHIVNTIGSIDDLVENKQSTLIKLENIASFIYKQYAKRSKFTLRIGNVCDIKTGKLDANASATNGLYPFFTCGRETLRINDYAFDSESIIISGNGDISVKYYKGKFNAYQRTYVLSPKEYFFLFLEECKSCVGELISNSQGSVIKFITKGMLEKISISLNDDAIEVNDKLRWIYNQILSIKKEIEELVIIKQTLLSKYF